MHLEVTQYQETNRQQIIARYDVMKNGKTWLTLIIARPGRLRDGLLALVTTIPQIKIVGLMDYETSVLWMVDRYQPALVVLDCSLFGDEVRSWVEHIKALQPQTQCLVMANSAHQQELAVAGGAGEVLLKGFPATELFSSVERLLAENHRLNSADRAPCSQ